MKFDQRIKSSSSNKRKVLSLIIVSISLMLLAVVLVVVDPIKTIVKSRARVSKNSEIMQLLLQKNSPGIRISVYLFNITNGEKFISGEDYKLKLQEIGPFTYQEQRSNEDVEMDDEERVVRYTPQTTTRFLPEYSIADPTTINVTMPNVAMLSMSSVMASQPYFTKLGFSLLLGSLRSRPVVPQTAQEFLWGYNEPLIRLGNTIMPGWISFETLGILDRLYDNKVNYRLEVGATNDDRFRIKSMNGIKGLNGWDYEEVDKRSSCNTFTDAYEGIAYPNYMSDGTPIRIFRNVLCRFLPLDYQGTKTVNSGVKVLIYKVSDMAFDITNDTQCLCSRGTCIKGVSDLSPCFYQLPLALSNAHFLNGDPSLFERIDGLKPDESKHGSEFVVEPKLGMVMKTYFSVQVNVVVRNVEFNNQAARFSNMVVPLCHFKMEQPELTEKDFQTLHTLYVTAPYSFWAFIVALLLCGLLTLVFCVRMFLTNWIYSRDVIIFQSPEDIKSGVTSSIPLLGL
ncbi:hypothetical protein ACJJTC_003587 [Scirpophaga incertulas]